MKSIAVMTLLVLAVPGGAFAQASDTRGFISLNGGYQVTTHRFDDSATFRANAEDARFTTDSEVKGGPVLDVAGGAMVWRSLGIGVGLTRFSRATSTALSGSIPHPFFFNTPRAVSGDVSGLKREELAVHVQARFVVPMGDRFQVMVFGGPSVFQVRQGIVRDFSWNESYPYDEATLGSVQTENAKGTKVGFNAGGDVAFFFTRQIGVGGTVQLSQATVEVSGLGSDLSEIKAGGVRAGGGLRVRF